MTHSISIVFPMYNEEEYISKAIELAKRVLSGISEDYEIIIVNDASTDDSGKIAEILSDKNPHIKVIHHRKNRKLGGSLKSGFAAASKELTLYSDMDIPFDFNEINKAVQILDNQKVDLVCAYRLNVFADGAKRYSYRILYNLFIKIIFRINIKDINFSFKLIKTDLLRRLELSSEGSFIDAEMLIKATRRGAKIAEFGTTFFPRLHGKSKLSSLSVIFKILKESLAFRFELLKNKK